MNAASTSLLDVGVGMQTSSVPNRPLQLASIFPREATIIGLNERSKPGVTAEMVRRLAQLGEFPAEREPAIVDIVLAREKAGSTALGNGIAMPHCRTGYVKRLVGVVGIDQHGLTFDAVDGEPVYVIFLLLAPLEDRAQHFEVLGQISAIGKDKALRMCLRGSRTPDDVQRLLEDWNRNLSGFST